MTRRLLLLRHAEAEPGHSVEDIERELTPPGRQAVTRFAGLVARYAPELVLCSPARRTVQTAEALGLQPTIDPDLYSADADGLADRIRSVPDDHRSVLVIGHNPALQQLAAWLAGRQKLPLPTGGLAVLEVHSSWAALDADTTGLERLELPAG